MATLKSILKLKLQQQQQQQHHQTIPMQHNKQGQKSLIILFFSSMLPTLNNKNYYISITIATSKHYLLCYDYYKLCYSAKQ